MNFLFLAYFSVFLINLFLGIFVIVKNPRHAYNICTGIIALSSSAWNLAWAIRQFIPVSPWSRLSFLMGFVPPAFLLFTLLVHFNQQDFKKFKSLAIALFIPQVFTMALIPTDLLTGGPRDILLLIMRIYWLILLVLGLIVHVLSYRKKDLAIPQTTRIYLSLAACFYATAGILGTLIAPFFFGPLAFGGIVPLTSVIFVLGMTLAITKTGLMDISIVISRSLAEFLATAFYLIIYLVSTWLYLSYISSSIDLILMAWTILYGVLIGQTYQFIRLKIQTTSDKLILHGKYDYYKELAQASTEAARKLSLPDILKVLYRTFHEVIEIHNPRIFLPEDSSSPAAEKHRYLVYDKTTLLPQPQGEEIEFHDPLVAKLVAQRKPLINEKDRDRHLIIPCLFEDHLIGLFVLGKKLSEDPYTDKDLQLLQVLANQTAISIENARATEELQKAHAELKRAHAELKKHAETLEEKVKERTAELQEKMTALKDFNDLAVNRELKMMELEKEVNKLLAELGREGKGLR